MREARGGSDAEAPEGATPGELAVRDLRPADVEGLCALLSESFRREYQDQGLDVWKFRRQYGLVAWANLLLIPLRLEFFQVVVVLLEGRVVGTMTSFPAGPGVWYQGFGAVDPGVRRRGVYKRVIRASLDSLARRRVEAGGGEIRIDNPGALRPYRTLFGCEIVPVKSLYLADPDRLPAPEGACGLVRISQGQFHRLGEAELLRRRFRGGFLVEEDVDRGLVACLLRRWLPPLTTRSWGLFDDGRLLAFLRLRTHWPARIQALDAIYFAPDLDRRRARQALLQVLDEARRRTNLQIRIYVEGSDADGGATGESTEVLPGDRLLRELCRELGFELLSDIYPIRTDVAEALARTTPDGSLRPGLGPRPLPPLSSGSS